MHLPPDELQDTFYQCAPRDQQCPRYLVGGEPVELLNLSPSGALRFTLPRVQLVVTATIAGAVEESRPQVHTALLRPDVPSVTLAWHCSFPCQNRSNKISDIAVREIVRGGHTG